VRAKKWLGWVVSLLFCFSALFAEKTLRLSDVRPLVQELMSFHVDQTKFSSQLMRRSLKTFSEQCDPYRIYLLESEVSRLLSPSPEELTQAIDSYYKDQYPLHNRVLDKVQGAVARARKTRSELRGQWLALFDRPDQWKTPYERQKNFVSSEKMLRERWMRMFRHFLQEQAEAWPVELLQQRREAVIALFERRFIALEESHLLHNDQGQPLSTAEATHQRSVWILKSLARSLDPHTEYFDPAEAYNIRIQLEKGLCGIGVVLEEGFDGIRIVDLVPGGPAAECQQLRANDLIVSIDGHQTTQLPFKRVLQLLRGDNGSTVTLGVQRFGEETASLNEVTLRRGSVVLQDHRIDVSSEPFGDGIIGRIALHSFYESERGVSSEADVMEALRTLRAKGPLRGLVLDLRDNTGGFLTQAIRVAGLFITSGVVVQSKYGDGQVRVYRDLDGYAYYTGPMVVLTSRMTASAAEIVAQALQDYGVALVVGDDHTFGKGSIQNQTITSDKSDSSFKVTVARYYTVSGKSPQRDGVAADIVVPTAWAYEPVGERFLDFALEPDTVSPAFQDALADIHGRARPWYQQYYLPSVQAPSKRLQALLPQLRRNSSARIEKNESYQKFLATHRRAEATTQVSSSSRKRTDDLPLTEAYNIVKDMVLINSPQTSQRAELHCGK
jgi:carboxyl-terminal processing protease